MIDTILDTARSIASLMDEETEALGQRGRLAVHLNRVVNSAHILHQCAQVEGCQHVVRLDLQRLLVMIFRKGEFARFLKQSAQVDVGVGVTGIQFNGTQIGGGSVFRTDDFQIDTQIKPVIAAEIVGAVFGILYCFLCQGCHVAGQFSDGEIKVDLSGSWVVHLIVRMDDHLTTLTAYTNGGERSSAR